MCNLPNMKMAPRTHYVRCTENIPAGIELDDFLGQHIRPTIYQIFHLRILKGSTCSVQHSKEYWQSLCFLKQITPMSVVISLMMCYNKTQMLIFLWVPFMSQYLGPEIIPPNSLRSESDVFNQQCPFLE